MKKLLTFAMLLLVSALLAAEKRPKYIFLFIGDGMSVPQRMIADEYASHTDHGPLTINNLKYQAMTTTKCMFSNACYAIRTHYSRQTRTVSKGLSSNTGHIIANCHRS